MYSLKLDNNNSEAHVYPEIWGRVPFVLCALLSLFLLLFPNSFIHSLNRYFLRNSYELGILIGSRDTGENRVDSFHLYHLVEKTDTEQVVTSTVNEGSGKQEGVRLSLNDWVEVSQVRWKLGKERRGGIWRGAASASEFMLNLFRKHTCDPVGVFGVYILLEYENKSGRCKSCGWNFVGIWSLKLLGHFWKFTVYPIGKSHWGFKQVNQRVLSFRRISIVASGCEGMKKRAELSWKALSFSVVAITARKRSI